jgi:hypothetical protein
MAGVANVSKNEQYDPLFSAHNASERIPAAAQFAKDTELGVKMEPEVGHGATEIYPRVQA